MTSDNLNRRPVVAAAITAGFLILILGLTYRVLAARLLTPRSKTPIAPAALDGFPLQIHDWTGEDVPLDEAEVMLDKICAEASINRLYSRDNGTESIFLFIAASGVTVGTMVGHAPEDCNRSAGWMLTDHRFIELVLDHGTKLVCRIVQLFRGRLLEAEKKIVLYYYVADGQFYGNRSQLRSRVNRGSNMVNCFAQVQIIASSKETLTTDSMVRIVSDFAVDSASSIAELFEHIQKDQNVDSPRALKEGGSR